MPAEGSGMQPLSAEIITEQLIGDDRSAIRRTLRLGVAASYSGDFAMALILNLSETGLLIETLVELAEGEALQIEFSEGNASTARVVWTTGLLAGCEFIEPISTAVVSAAQLRSYAAHVNQTNEEPAPVQDLSLGAERPDYEESVVQSTILLVMSLISVLALLIFLAAVFPL
jgi:hypothetical protein